ncbi:carbohydrate binding domain-containing protein [Enterococcus casseliflavus]|uniref:carbohydrate binding domain-containing protein n=1 Tax=Enterococcus casseliflavus TaxID=37734 RepID=UPI003015C8C4
MSNIRVRSRLSITDLNDQISGATAPSNPEEKSLWLDTSVSPPILKYWDGSTWIPQRLDISELDPDLSITIETIEATMGNMANDNILDIKERGIIVDNINEIIGYLISNKTNAPATLPSVATLDASKKGNFYQTRATARNAGISTSAVSYVAVGTTYNALASYLGNMTPIKPWDITDLNKDKNVTVVKDTFRQTWLNYYLAVQKLVEDTALQVKSQIDDHEDRITTVSAGFDTLKDSIKFYATKDEVKNSLTAYPTKTEMDAQLNLKADEINLGVKTSIESLSPSDRNLLRKSNVAESSQSYMIKSYNMSEMMVEGEDYVFRAKMSLGSGKTWAGIWLDGGLISLVGRLTKDTDGTYYARFKGKKGANTTTNIIYVYVGEGSVTGVTSSIEWAKLTKSNVLFRQWTPAPEDTNESITGAVTESKTYTDSQIKVNSDAIKLGIDQSKSYTDTQINNVNVGTRNLFRGFPNNEDYVVKTNTQYFIEYNTLTTLGALIPFSTTEEYTFSCTVDVKSSTSTQLSISIGYANVNGAFVQDWVSIPHSGVTGVYKISKTFKMNTVMGATSTPNFAFRFARGGQQTTSEVVYKDIMLVKGNKTAEWQQAVEDSKLNIAWSNKEDGSVDFTTTYPNENLLLNARTVTVSSNNASLYPITTQILSEDGFNFVRVRRDRMDMNAGVLSLFTAIAIGETAKQITGKKVALSCMVRASSQVNMSLMAKCLTPTSVSLEGDGRQDTIGKTWQQVKLTVNNFPANVSIIRFNPLQVASPVPNLSNFYLDLRDWKVEILPDNQSEATIYTPPPSEDPIGAKMAYVGYSPIPSQKPNGYVWQLNSDNIQKKAWANDPTGYTDFTIFYPNENILKNGSVRNDISEWTASSGLQVQTVSGEYTKLTKAVSSTRLSLAQSVTSIIEQNTQYSISAWVYVESASSAQTDTNMYIRAATSDGSYVDLPKVSIDLTKTGTWQRLEATGLIRDVVITSAFLYLSMSASASMVLRVRDFKLERGSIPTVYTPAPSEDSVGAEMQFEGISLKGGMNPADYTWSPMKATLTEVKQVQLQLTPDSIYAKVSQAPDYIDWKLLVDSKPSIDDLNNVYDQLEGLSSADETILASMAELEIANNGVLTSITQAIEGMDGTLSTITDYMFFGTSGLTIGKSDSPMKVNISNTELAFYDNSTKVAWVDSQRLNIREALIEKKIKVGNHIIEKFDDKEEITIFKYDGV